MENENKRTPICWQEATDRMLTDMIAEHHVLTEAKRHEDQHYLHTDNNKSGGSHNESFIKRNILHCKGYVFASGSVIFTATTPHRATVNPTKKGGKQLGI